MRHLFVFLVCVLSCIMSQGAPYSLSNKNMTVTIGEDGSLIHLRNNCTGHDYASSGLSMISLESGVVRLISA